MLRSLSARSLKVLRGLSPQRFFEMLLVSFRKIPSCVAGFRKISSNVAGFIHNIPLNVAGILRNVLLVRCGTSPQRSIECCGRFLWGSPNVAGIPGESFWLSEIHSWWLDEVTGYPLVPHWPNYISQTNGALWLAVDRDPNLVQNYLAEIRPRAFPAGKSQLFSSKFLLKTYSTANLTILEV